MTDGVVSSWLTDGEKSSTSPNRRTRGSLETETATIKHMADKELTEKDKEDLRALYKKAVMTGWLVQEDLEKSAQEKKKNE